MLLLVVMVTVITLYRQALVIVDELKSCINDLEDDINPVIELMDPNVATIYSKSLRAKVIN